MNETESHPNIWKYNTHVWLSVFANINCVPKTSRLHTQVARVTVQASPQVEQLKRALQEHKRLH